MTKRYFGTDGIRGKVGESLLQPEFIMKLGWAAGKALTDGEGGRILIGKDTRISGYMFESALEAGLSAAGVDIALLGPMPTPAIAYLTHAFRAAGGIVISASHNPYYDNGIKFLSAHGKKLADETEYAIEALLEQPISCVESAKLGKAKRFDDAYGRYIEYCKGKFPANRSLEGLKIVIDCANGATYQIAPAVFSELGANVIAVAVEPDGLNINLECGATKPELLRRKTLAHGADLGIALDGDGDRVIMVDHTGTVVDGDDILYILAQAHLANGGLQGVVGTLMSNMGLEVALRDLGVEFERTRVGDRYVMQALEQREWVLGGETSGHIICLDQAFAGDGIIAALQVLACVVASGQCLQDLRHGLEKYPQIIINVPLVREIDPYEHSVVKQAVHAGERILNNHGRIVLRPSGTEPLLRVMVEGRDIVQIKEIAQSIADALGSAMA